MKVGLKVMVDGQKREIGKVRDGSVKLVGGMKWLKPNEITVCEDQSGPSEGEAFERWKLRKHKKHAIYEYLLA